ncbi:MAG: PDZ domain-containing protein, partial [Planctomycetota bacterium]
VRTPNGRRGVLTVELGLDIPDSRLRERAERIRAQARLGRERARTEAVRAALAGLRPGDGIVEFDGKRPQFFEQLKEAILARSPGDRVKIRLRRRGEELELECELGWAPGE